jgi:hypothetical protein
MSESITPHCKSPKNQSFLLFIVILTYFCLFFTDVFGYKFDTFSMIFIGLYSWVFFLFRMSLPFDRVTVSFFFVVIYIGASSYTHLNSFNVFKYFILFFLIFGSYLFFKVIFKDVHLYEKFNSYFIWCQSFTALAGILDYLLFSYGIVSPVRDYIVSNQVDSFYNNPNPFGVMCVFALVSLVNSKIFLRWQSYVLGFILLAGVLVSDSNMSLLLILVWFCIHFFGFFKVLVFGFITLFLLLEVSFDFALVLNKRLDIWIKAFIMWLDYPIFGLGFGNFQLTNENLDVYKNINSTHGLHSMWAWAIFELGAFGFFLFSAFIILVFVASKKCESHINLLLILILFSQITEFFLDHEEVFIMFFVATVARISAVSSQQSAIKRDYYEKKII